MENLSSQSSNGTQSNSSNGFDAQSEAVEEQEQGASLQERVEEIFEYLSCYLEAKVLRGKLGLKQILWKAVLTLCFGLLAAGSLLVALAFIFYGAALALAELFGNRLWLGYLSSGGIFFAVTWIYLQAKRSNWLKASAHRKLKEYEQKLAEQRSKFGRDIEG